jgi:hypothetical protein
MKILRVDEANSAARSATLSLIRVDLTMNFADLPERNLAFWPEALVSLF